MDCDAPVFIVGALVSENCSHADAGMLPKGGGGCQDRRNVTLRTAVDGAKRLRESSIMRAELTAIIEQAPEGGYWAVCAEVPGANGQGETIEEAKESLRDAIRLIFEDRLADMKRGLPEDAIQEVIAI